MRTEIEERHARKVDVKGIIEMAVHRCKVIELWNKERKNEIVMVDTTLTTRHTDKRTGKVKEETKTIRATKRPSNAHMPSIKKKQAERLAVRIDKLLGFTNSALTHNKIALTTYTAYLSDVRIAIQKDTNLKSPNLESDIRKLISDNHKFPLVKVLQPILDADAINVAQIKSAIVDNLNGDNRVVAKEIADKLNSIEVHHPLIAKLIPSTKNTKIRKKVMNERRDERNTNVKAFNHMQVKEIIVHCLSSDDFYELVLGVALATGRRAIEVARVGIFSENPSERLCETEKKGVKLKKSAKTDVLFSGVAKKRNLVQNTKSYIIPTEYDANRIVSAVERIKNTERYKVDTIAISNLSKNKRNDIVNGRIANGLNKCIRRLFNDDELVFKDSRGIAGMIAYNKFHKQDRYKTLSANAFYQHYFIHDTLEQSVDYGHFKLDDGKQYVPVSELKTKSNDVVLKPDVLALEAITDDLIYVDAKGMKPVVKLHAKVIGVMAKTGFALSLASIYKGKKHEGKQIKIGGSQAVIKRYLALDIVQDAIEKFHDNNSLKVRS